MARVIKKDKGEFLKMSEDEMDKEFDDNEEESEDSDDSNEGE